ncbi:MAG: hypothetical protein AB8U25_04310 [Rickettsiales endosymbiont of Dermacentor nuttalli]
MFSDNYKIALEIAIVNNKILNKNEIRDLLERKSAVKYILMYDKFYHSNNINENLATKLIDNALARSHVGKYTLALLGVSMDLSNS